MAGIHPLVTKSIPGHSIAVGVPATVVKSDISWEI
jgi:acetyltransferase-like isoleucine patch superfamily enzyme